MSIEILCPKCGKSGVYMTGTSKDGFLLHDIKCSECGYEKVEKIPIQFLVKP